MKKNSRLSLISRIPDEVLFLLSEEALRTYLLMVFSASSTKRVGNIDLDLVRRAIGEKFCMAKLPAMAEELNYFKLARVIGITVEGEKYSAGLREKRKIGKLHFILMEEKKMTKPKILVVDDNEGIRVCLSMLFDDKYITATAVNGKEALKMLKREKFDLIITDYEMPGMGGVELIKQVRSGDKDQPIILTILSQLDPVVDEIFMLGSVEIVTKPFEIDYLLKVVAKLL